MESAIQSDGSMKDTASPELRRLTHQAQGLKQEMRQHLEQILHSNRHEDVLQESYFAQREGRYVVPVKADMRGNSGIVDDVSVSGATVFLEPRELVELNNSIKVADLVLMNARGCSAIVDADRAGWPPTRIRLGKGSRCWPNAM